MVLKNAFLESVRTRSAGSVIMKLRDLSNFVGGCGKMIAIFPEIINLVLNREVERLAYAVRKYHGIPTPNAPILAFEEMLKNIGIQYGSWQFEDLAGIVAQDRGGSFQVSMCLPQALTDDSQTRYLQAFLLGRFYLDLSPAIASSGELSGGYKVDRQCWQELTIGQIPTQILGTDQGWQDAHLFAQSILLPKAMVRRAMQVISNDSEVAKFFAVTEQFLQTRMQDFETDTEKLTQANSPGKARANEMEAAPRKMAIETRKDPKALKSGLARLRELAKQMDPSVKLDR